MKFKDLEVGMMVAIGTPGSVLDGDAECAIVLDIGGWNDRDAGGSFPLFSTRPKERLHRGGGKGVAVATSYEMVRRYFDGKYAKRPKWYPGVVQANRILCSWDEALGTYGRAKARRDESRQQTRTERQQTKKVAAHLARMGVKFGFEEYRKSITLDADQMKHLQALLVDLMPNSMQAMLPKIVVHWEGTRPNEAVCGVTGLASLGKGALDKVGVNYHKAEDVTCPECLAMLKRAYAA